MARVAVLCRDLLFGSKLQGALRAGGHDVRPPDDAEAEVLVVDLTDQDVDGLGAARAASVPTLGFYSHVDQETRRRAEEAGFDRVVPRSRMAREAATLVETLVAA